jgi:hypothetical protein
VLIIQLIVLQINLHLYENKTYHSDAFK